MLPIARFILALLVLVVALSAAHAEVYRWTDDQGQIHFTQDLTQVPARYRAGAKDATGHQGPSRVHRISTPTVPESASQPDETASPPAAPAGESYQIPVVRAGSAMRVKVLLNDRVEAPFIIDTGASDVLIPLWVAEQLGIDVEEATRTQIYRTASGVVEQPVVMLGSVELGGARAENVPASVSPSMSIGLLGLSFFNRFIYNVDPERGLVTLTPNRLEEMGEIRGGRSESEWRTSFHVLRARISSLRGRISETNPARTRAVEALREDAEALEEQLDELDGEAAHAGVPQSWRE